MRAPGPALVLVGCAVLACSGERAPEVQTDTLAWMRVEDGRLVDEVGREWLLRGVNARIEGVFDVVFDDGRTRLQPIPEFGAEDARAIAAMGFNFLRLPINWSGLEPEEGLFSDAYLERVEAVIEGCRKAGLYVLVDFHQDAWSKHIGEDGAPLWAIQPPPEQLLEGPLNDLSERRLSGQVLRAFESFFTNAGGLQDRFVPAWQRVIRRWRDAPHVLGFEAMNEPVIFQRPDGEELLQAFNLKMSRAMREVDSRHTLWLEPDSIRNFSLEAPLRPEPFPDRNVVYSPHLYPFTLGLDGADEAAWQAGLAGTVEKMVEEAESWGAALVVGEWGQNLGVPAPFPYLRAVQQLFEQRRIGHAFWLWKEHTQGFWGFFDHDFGTGAWTPRQEGMKELSRPAALAVPGRLLEHRFEPETRELRVRFRAFGNEAAPLLFVPEVWYPEGAEITLGGNAVEAHFGRMLLPWSGERGERDIVVRPR